VSVAVRGLPKWSRVGVVVLLSQAVGLGMSLPLSGGRGATAAPAKPGSHAIALPSDADVRRVLAERVEALAGPEGGIGIVVGVVGPEGRRVIS
jgi:hypothetical protein